MRPWYDDMYYVNHYLNPPYKLGPIILTFSCFNCQRDQCYLLCFILISTRDGNFAPTHPDPCGYSPPRRGDEAITGYINCPDTRGRAVTDFI